LGDGGGEPQTDRSPPLPVTVIDLDVFFIIQDKAKWLPPVPADPDATIEGVDADGDCVRDDIEHYIASRYRAQSDYLLRKHLYEYAAWMGRFLISNISVNTAKTSSNNMGAASECISNILDDSVKAIEVLNDLFARFHNTCPRSFRYIENTSRLGGWTRREDVSVNCT